MPEKIEIDLFGEELPRWTPSREIEEQAILALKDALPLEMRASDADLEESYQKAYNLYQSGRFKDALPYFSLLCLARPNVPRFLMALGATYHMLKQYPAAITYYSLGYMLDPNNPRLQYHIADCWLQMEELPGAYIALEMGIEQAKKNPKFKNLLDRMQSMQNNLIKELEEKKKMGVTDFRGTQYSDPVMEKLKEKYKHPNDLDEFKKMMSAKKKRK